MNAPPARALGPQRREAILRQLEASGAVLVADIALHFGISQETVRRDLKAMALRGEVELTHGGATRPAMTEAALESRSVRNVEAKSRIGAYAARMVQDGMVVLLDAGSTTAAIAAHLGRMQNLTVITTSLPIALSLSRSEGIRVQITGGTINPGDDAAEGPEALSSIARFRVDLAFVSAGGVAPDGTITDFTPMGAETRAQMISAADRGYFVLDRSKFGALTPCRISARPAGLITDADPPQQFLQPLASRGIDLLLP